MNLRKIRIKDIENMKKCHKKSSQRRIKPTGMVNDKQGMMLKMIKRYN